MQNFMKVFFIFLITTFSGVALSQTYTVETVPNTKLVSNSYVSNPDNLLSASTVDQINQQLKILEDSSTAQVAVVMLTSIGDADVFDFAQQLFRTWGLGQADKDNGLLILYVQDQRIIRFHTGFGIEGILPDITCKQIQTKYMVPLFKEGDIDGGMLAGIDAVTKILIDPSYASEIHSETEEVWDQANWMYGISFIFVFVWIFGGLITFFSERKNGFSNSKGVGKPALNPYMSQGQWLLFCYLIPLVGLVYLAYLENFILYFTTIYGYIL